MFRDCQFFNIIFPESHTMNLHPSMQRRHITTLRLCKCSSLLCMFTNMHRYFTPFFDIAYILEIRNDNRIYPYFFLFIIEIESIYYEFTNFVFEFQIINTQFEPFF